MAPAELLRVGPGGATMPLDEPGRLLLRGRLELEGRCNRASSNDCWERLCDAKRE